MGSTAQIHELTVDLTGNDFNDSLFINFLDMHPGLEFHIDYTIPCDPEIYCNSTHPRSYHRLQEWCIGELDCNQTCFCVTEETYNTYELEKATISPSSFVDKDLEFINSTPITDNVKSVKNPYIIFASIFILVTCGCGLMFVKKDHLAIQKKLSLNLSSNKRGKYERQRINSSDSDEHTNREETDKNDKTLTNEFGHISENSELDTKDLIKDDNSSEFEDNFTIE